MLTSSFLLLALSWCVVQGAVVPRSHVIHEKRGDLPLRWAKRDRIGSEAILPMRIGLRQSNLHKADSLLMEISHPKSPNYGKHWTSDEVIQMFAPSEDTVSSVRDWLVEHGISSDRIVHSDNQGWLAFDATNEEAESLLHTEYYEYEHRETGDVTVACDVYHVPKNVKEHIDYVTPGLRLISRSSISKRSASTTNYALKPIPLNKIGGGLKDLTHCDTQITPDCIAALYNIPPGTLNDSSNAMGIYEYGDTYAQEDLDAFFKNLAPQIPPGTSPTPAFVDGAEAPAPQFGGGGESSLDLQVSYPILWPQGVVLFQTDDDYYTDTISRGLFNDFLDSIDGSYCTFSSGGETGNDAIIDHQYPNPNGGYQGILQCGIYKPPNVVSLSYGLQEADLPAYYQERQCQEFMKLGLQGVSVIFASGDSGVGGRGGCLGSSGRVFNPTYPANCPYVTTVGATEVYPGQTVQDPESAPDVFGSGGGFSNLYNTPDYQQDAVNAYFKNHNPPYPYYFSNGSIPNNGGLYNRIGRGIPDVSANGLNAAVYILGELFTTGGTSQSAPIFASIINRINEERIAKGKGPVGFVNPVLYQHPEILNDITNGTNAACYTDGFSAVSGWDPVTGLGTPNYPKMLDLFLGLN